MSLGSIKVSDKEQVFTGLSSDTKPTTTAKAGNKFLETDTGNVYEYSDTSWYQLSTGGAAHTRLTADDTKTTFDEEIYEIVAPGTTGAASIASNVWVATRDIAGGMIYAKGDSITSTTAWTLNAHYSFDGITEITSEAIATGTSAVATGAETISVNWNESADTADALGFARKIKDYPFVKFSLTFTNGTAAGTAESSIRVVRRNG